MYKYVPYSASEYQMMKRAKQREYMVTKETYRGKRDLR
jgi:hypothetical protein